MGIYDKVEKYMDETVTSGDVANYDKKIGDKGTTETDSIEIVMKTDQTNDIVETINKIAKSSNLDVDIPDEPIEKGDVIKLSGPTEKIRQVEMKLKELGIR